MAGDIIADSRATSPGIRNITVEVAPLHLYDELSTVQLVGAA